MSGADKFRWPVKGKVVTDFAGTKGTGINIDAPEGSAVRAAENGTVIYVGSGVEGYGNLILIRHANGYVSAYAHLKSMSVAKGDVVSRGDTIGAAGMTGSVSRPQLHFELPKGATPVDPVPLEPDPVEPLDKIVVYVPVGDAERVRTALTEAGAGSIGDYDSCTFTTPGEGRFRPLEGANPTIGAIGSLEVVDEVRVESVCARGLRERVLAAMRAAHPYEEPAYDVFEMAGVDDHTRGSGRIGRLDAPMSLQEFADRAADVLPPTAHGVRVAGDPAQSVETVALCGGAGDFLLDRARTSGADVYVTSDLRHHPASEARVTSCRTPGRVGSRRPDLDRTSPHASTSSAP